MAEQPTGTGEVLPIALDGYEGGWVEIKRKRGWAAATAIDSSAVTVQRQQDGGTVGVVDLVAQGLATLDAILSWSLDPAPGRAYFESDDFDEALGEWLIDAINAYYDGQKRTTEARRD